VFLGLPEEDTLSASSKPHNVFPCPTSVVGQGFSLSAPSPWTLGKAAASADWSLRQRTCQVVAQGGTGEVAPHQGMEQADRERPQGSQAAGAAGGVAAAQRIHLAGSSGVRPHPLQDP